MKGGCLVLNRELVLYDGGKVYPAYVTQEDRKDFVKRFGEKREYMWCGCRDDARLYYRFSADGRIYPEHKDYAHARGCIFEAVDRKERAFVQDAETGETRMFLSFDPRQFSVPSDAGTAETPGFGKLPMPERQNDGLNYYPLESFVKQVNTDTFNERMALGKGVLSREYFMPALFARLRGIVIDGCRKPVRDYTLRDDRWQFFYTDFVRYEKKERGDGKASCSLIVKDRDGKEYSWFIYEKTLVTAAERFRACYGTDPNDADRPLVMSGFRYVRTRKDSNETYKVVGRLYIAPVSRNGLIGRNVHETESLDAVGEVLRRNRDLKFFIGDVGDPFWGYFEKKGVPRKLIVAYAGSDYPEKGAYKIDFERNTLTAGALEGFINDKKEAAGSSRTEGETISHEQN